MISTRLRVAMLAAVFIYYLLVFHLLKKKSLNLKYTLLWICSGMIMFVLAIFPELLDHFAGLVGVYDATNALFAMIFFCIIVILMSLTAIVSKLNEKCKRLIQSMALLEKRLREVEEKEVPGETFKEEVYH